MDLLARPPRRITNHDIASGAGMALLSKVGAVIELVSQPIYIWLFGLAGYGLYAVLWSAVNLIENFADLGMTSALQRVVPQARDRDQRVRALRAALAIGVLPCVAVALAAVLLADTLATYINVAAADRATLAADIRLFAVALPLWAFVEVATSALRACRVFGAEIRLRTFWEQIIRLFLAISLWTLGFGIRGLLLAHLLSLAIVAILSFRLLIRHYGPGLIPARPRVPDTILRDTLWAGLASLPYNIAARVYSDAPALLLNGALPGEAGATAAALYLVARKVSSLAQMIRVAFAYVVAPLASEAAAIGDSEAISELYGFAARLSAAIALPLTAALCAGAPAILDYFGREGASAWTSVAILSAARAIEAAGGQAAQIQQVIGRYRHAVYASLLGIGFAGGVAWVAVPAWGLDGASASVAAGLLLSTAISLHQVNRQHRMHPFERRFVETSVRALAIAVLVFIASGVTLMLPPFIRIGAWLPILLLGSWCSLRWALGSNDKAALGRLSGLLRL